MLARIRLNIDKTMLKAYNHLTPILPEPEYDYVRESLQLLHTIHAKHNRCKIFGHIWEIHKIITNGPDKPTVYISACFRCFPHTTSRREFLTYNLFTYTDKDAD